MQAAPFFEKISVLIFLVLFLSLYGLALLILLDLRPKAGRFWQRSLPDKAWRAAVILVATIGLGCVAYGYFVEPYQLKIVHIKLASPLISPKTGDLKVVLISDLHCDKTPMLEERLPDVIAAQHPDIILFAGDSLNCAEALPRFKSLLTRFVAIAPTFVVKGDWDFCLNPRLTDLDFWGGTGASTLVQPVQLEVRGTTVTLAGADSKCFTKASVAGIDPKSYKIFLYHYPAPDIIHAFGSAINLFCCGHTHGGQVALPFWGAVITDSHWGKQFEAGLYKVDSTWMYVTRGIGMDGHYPPIRFGAKPEVVVFDLENSN